MPKATNTSAGCWPSVGAATARGCRLTAVVMRPSCSEGELVGPAPTMVRASVHCGHHPFRMKAAFRRGSSDPHDAERERPPGPSRPMTPPPGPAPVDPVALLRTRSYVQLLVLAGGIIGVPVSGVAYGFLWLVSELQDALFSDLPDRLGYDDGAGLVADAGRSRSAACSSRRRSSGSRAPAGTRRPTASSPPAPCPRSSSPASRSRPSRPSASVRCSAPRRRSSPSAAAWACSRCASPPATRRRWPRP